MTLAEIVVWPKRDAKSTSGKQPPADDTFNGSKSTVQQRNISRWWSNLCSPHTASVCTRCVFRPPRPSTSPFVLVHLLDASFHKNGSSLRACFSCCSYQSRLLSSHWYQVFSCMGGSIRSSLFLTASTARFAMLSHFTYLGHKSTTQKRKRGDERSFLLSAGGEAA